MSSHFTHQSTFSDHAMLEINKAAKKNVQNTKKFLKNRSMKNFIPQDFKERIKNHHLFIETLYETNTDVISNNITKILQYSADPTAPVVCIQLSAKNVNPLSLQARQALIDRDLAQQLENQTPTQENIRNHKNLHKLANKINTKERFEKKKLTFKEETSIKRKWQKAKLETGQSCQTSLMEI